MMGKLATVPLVVLLLFGCGEKSVAAAVDGKRVALVIGNQQYQQAGAALSRPEADATALAAILQQYDFKLLDDKVHTNLSKEALESALQRFEQAAQGAEVALVYYAGHGVQDQKANYLIPVDAQISSKAQIKYQAVDLGLVLDHLQEAGTRLNLVFLDACRDNPFVGGRSLARGLARVTPSGKGETLISYSTSEGSVAADDSLYSSALARLIKEHPAQPIQMLLAQVGAEVKQKSNDTQHPDYTTSVTTTFCFGGCQQVVQPIIPIAAATSPVAVSPALGIAPPPVPAAPSRQVFEPEMVAIPAGSFTMGCDPKRDDVDGGCSGDEKPAHAVSISAFQMAKTETTFEQWDACEAAKVCPHADDEGWGRGKRPVINVSWQDTQTYIGWLNAQTGKHYRLPTEAEWEYAARGGTEGAYPWGNSIGKGKANCDSDCGDKFNYTAPVGSFAANGYGLNDMHGNVWEWCGDWMGGYASSPASNPQGAGSGAYRVLRGGSWFYDAQGVRSAFRSNSTPDFRDYNMGFRLVLP